MAVMVQAQKPPFETVPETKGLSHQQLVQQDSVQWVTIVPGLSKLRRVSIPRVKAAIEGRTSMIFNATQQQIPYEPSQFKKYPLLHLETCNAPPPLPLEDLLLWRDFFNRGGLLFLDTCGRQSTDSQSWKQWSASIYPGTRWAPLTTQQELAFSFYLLEKARLVGQGQQNIWVLKNDGRFMMIWNESPQLQWQSFAQSRVSPYRNSGDAEKALRFYVNVLMVALTGNYKQDQLHLPTILLRRK